MRPVSVFEELRRLVTAERLLAEPRATGAGVGVAVIDSGVERSVIAAKFPGARPIEGVRFGPSSPAPLPDYGRQSSAHGTVVADILLTVAPDITLYSADVFGPEGVCEVESVVAAIHHALEVWGVKVINLSLGVPEHKLQQLPRRGALLRAVEAAYFRGVTVVAAAHNDHPLTKSYPAAFATPLLAVDKALFADPLSFAYVLRESVEFQAHGRGYLGPTAREPATSWAAPHLAGIAARILSLEPGAKTLRAEDAAVLARRRLVPGEPRGVSPRIQSRAGDAVKRGATPSATRPYPGADAPRLAGRTGAGNWLPHSPRAAISDTPRRFSRQLPRNRPGPTPGRELGFPSPTTLLAFAPDGRLTAMNWLREADFEPLPGYRLVEPLGTGGFGEVWKCVAPGGIHKAIKFVYGNLNTLDDESAKAEQEFKAIERVKEVRHPFVLSMERIDVVGGELLIVMELADKSLYDVMQEYLNLGHMGIPRETLLGYLSDAAEGLDHLIEKHALQHLDVKPKNLFLIGERVKVADFGLVKHLERQSGSGLLGGITPVYAAPETFSNKISKHSDQYSPGGAVRRTVDRRAALQRQEHPPACDAAHGGSPQPGDARPQ